MLHPPRKKKSSWGMSGLAYPFAILDHAPLIQPESDVSLSGVKCCGVVELQASKRLMQEWR